jgi:glutaredoxin-like YruB-family protein
MSEVTIYTLPTCPYCKATKEYLAAKGVTYTEHDVASSQANLAEMQKISGGSRSVPVIVICKEVLVGFDQSRVEQALSCLKNSTPVV